MQEVTKQLGPLTEKVGALGNNLERLYNSNGGPPGFLQTARKEDDGRFKMIFNILDEHKEQLQPLTKWTEAHDVGEARRVEFQNTRDQEIKDHLARRDFWLMLAIGVMGLVLGWLTYRDAERKISVASPVSAVQSQQNAGGSMPPTY